MSNCRVRKLHATPLTNLCSPLDPKPSRGIELETSEEKKPTINDAVISKCFPFKKSTVVDFDLLHFKSKLLAHNAVLTLDRKNSTNVVRYGMADTLPNC